MPLRFQAFRKPIEVDQHALVDAAADLLRVVVRGDAEDDASSFDGGHDGVRRHPLSRRRGGEMPDVDDRAERGLARREVRTAFKAAFSMNSSMIGVARTGGSIGSLNRLARWSGATVIE